MRVPGSNLLRAALGVIGCQTVGYQRYIGMVTNAAGVRVVTWAEATPRNGSVQPVSSDLVQQYGLDFEKSYVTIFLPGDMGDVGRGRTGDRFTYAGKLYQIESKTPWDSQDCWSYALAVEVTCATV